MNKLKAFWNKIEWTNTNLLIAAVVVVVVYNIVQYGG